MIELRPYQAASVETVRALWGQGKRSVVLCAPTGAGKTAMAEALVRRVVAADFAQVWYISHTWDLIAQPSAQVQDIPHGFVKAGLSPDIMASVQFAQVQTMVRRPVIAGVDRAGQVYKRAVVIIDECHHLRSSTYLQVRQSLIDVYDIIYFLLLTATPYRRDGRSLGPISDALVEAVTPRELIADGYILDPVYYSAPPPEAGAAEYLASSKVQGDIVATWKRYARGLPTIGRAINRAHSRDVARRFCEAGVRADHIDGDMPQPVRSRLMARLAIGGSASDHPGALDVLCTGGSLLEEGVDSLATYRHALADRALWVGDTPPRYRPLGCLADWAPTTARGGWIQRIGRITRPHRQAQADRLREQYGAESDLKDTAVVLCHSRNLENHGFLVQHEGFHLSGDRAGAPTVKVNAYPAFRPPQTVSCPHCFATVARGAAACPACGATSEEVAAPALPDERADVELKKRVWDPTTAPPASDDDKEAFLRSQWAAWARARAAGKVWSPNWPAARFKAKYGAWPDWGMNRAMGQVFGGKV